MIEVIERIERKHKLYRAKGCTVQQVIEAEKKLGVKFSDEYRNYVLQYGAISFGSHEWTGLNVDDYVHVVHVTLEERAARANFPRDCIVVERLGIEGLILIQDPSGAIGQLDETGRRKPVADSLADYAETLI